MVLESRLKQPLGRLLHAAGLSYVDALEHMRDERSASTSIDRMFVRHAA
jgi:hypothetical protein